MKLPCHLLYRPTTRRTRFQRLRRLRFLVLFGILWQSIPTLSAQPYHITHYDVTIHVHQQYFDVKESLDVRFSAARHGIFRFIPLHYRMVTNGKEASFLDRLWRYPVFISQVDVPDRMYSASHDNGNLMIKIGDKNNTVTGLQHYEISYRVKNAFLSSDSSSTFYWNLIGDKWDTAIDTTTFSISLYEPIALSPPKYAVFTGQTGDKSQQATWNYHNGLLAGHSNVPLGYGKGMTVRIDLPPGYVQPLSSGAIWWYRLRWCCIPLALLFFFFYIWWKIGRDRRQVNVVAYQPPEGIDPAMTGFLINDRSDNIDAISLIPYWGAQGLLEMEQQKKKHWWSRSDWTLIRQRPLPEEAPAYCQTIFNGLFAEGDRVELSSLQGKFYKTLNSAKQQLQEEAMKRGYYTSSSVRVFHASHFAIMLVGIGAVALLIYLAQTLAVILTILVIIIMMLLNFLLLKRSKKGVAAFRSVQGFGMFVKKAERNKLEVLLKEDPSYFEKTLGYAVAFGVISSWVRKFDGLISASPGWYHSYGNGAFNASRFSSHFSKSMGQMNSALVNVPSGEGGSSGGSSGGGFGGGGGGSW